MQVLVALKVQRERWSPWWLTVLLVFVAVIGWATSQMQQAILAWMVLAGGAVSGLGLAVGLNATLRRRLLQAKHARFLAEGLPDLKRLGRLEIRHFQSASWCLAGAILMVAGLLGGVFAGLPISAPLTVLGLAPGILLAGGAFLHAGVTRSAVMAFVAPQIARARNRSEALRQLTPRWHSEAANRIAFGGGDATGDARKLVAIADHPGAFWPEIAVLPGHSFRLRMAALWVGLASLWRVVVAAALLAWALAAFAPFLALPPLPSPLALLALLESADEVHPSDDMADEEGNESTDAQPETSDDVGLQSGSDAQSDASRTAGQDGQDRPPDETTGEGANAGAPSGGGGARPDSGQGSDGSGGTGEPPPDVGTPGGSQGAASGLLEGAGGAGQGSVASEAGDPHGLDGQPSEAGGQGAGGQEAQAETDGPGEAQTETGGEATTAGSGSDEPDPAAIEQSPPDGQASSQNGGQAAPQGGSDLTDPQGQGGDEAQAATADAAPGANREHLQPSDASASGDAAEGGAGTQGPDAAPASPAPDAVSEDQTTGEAPIDGVYAARYGDGTPDPAIESPEIQVLTRIDEPPVPETPVELSLESTGWSGQRDTPAATRPNVQGFAAPGGMAQTLVAIPPDAGQPETNPYQTMQTPEQAMPSWVRGLFGL